MAASKNQSNRTNDIVAQVATRINESDNVLVTLSKDPSVDELCAALGLTYLLDKAGKHVTAIFSGDIPNAIEFLEPEKTFEVNTDSLRDFIIALDKEKADHLRYKVEGDYVKVFITPYKTLISQDDMKFSYGDYNVDLVIALNVKNEKDLDGALSEYGRIMHDATSINISADIAGNFADLEWGDPNVSSVCEMIYNLLPSLKDVQAQMDKTVATSFLTGIIASTNRFSNDRTTPGAFDAASRLMAAGADQRLISLNIPVEILTNELGGKSTEEKKEQLEAEKKAEEALEEQKEDATNISLHPKNKPSDGQNKEEKQENGKPNASAEAERIANETKKKAAEEEEKKKEAERKAAEEKERQEKAIAEQQAKIRKEIEDKVARETQQKPAEEAPAAETEAQPAETPVAEPATVEEPVAPEAPETLSEAIAAPEAPAEEAPAPEEPAAEEQAPEAEQSVIHGEKVIMPENNIVIDHDAPAAPVVPEPEVEEAPIAPILSTPETSAEPELPPEQIPSDTPATPEPIGTDQVFVAPEAPVEMEAAPIAAPEAAEPSPAPVQELATPVADTGAVDLPMPGQDTILPPPPAPFEATVAAEPAMPTMPTDSIPNGESVAPPSLTDADIADPISVGEAPAGTLAERPAEVPSVPESAMDVVGAMQASNPVVATSEDLASQPAEPILPQPVVAPEAVAAPAPAAEPAPVPASDAPSFDPGAFQLPTLSQ